MTVRMIFIRRLTRRANPDQADDVGGGVDQGVKAIRQDADGAAEIAEADLRERDAEVEQKHANENACH